MTRWAIALVAALGLPGCATWSDNYLTNVAINSVLIAAGDAASAVARPKPPSEETVRRHQACAQDYDPRNCLISEEK